MERCRNVQGYGPAADVKGIVNTMNSRSRTLDQTKRENIVNLHKIFSLSVLKKGDNIKELIGSVIT